jgi:peptidoglycan hydrolase FlgJ
MDRTTLLPPIAPGTAQAHRPAPIDRNDPAYKAAQEFEAVFLSQMVEQMHIGLKADGPFAGGFAEETYRSLMYQEIGRQMTQSGGVGIADAVYQEILKLQGAGK